MRSMQVESSRPLNALALLLHTLKSSCTLLLWLTGVAGGAAGSPIKVVVIGGSITCGGNTYTEDQRWINQVFQWINSTWPHPEHTLINACKPATPSMLFSFCMHQSVPDDTDLLLMEVQPATIPFP